MYNNDRKWCIDETTKPDLQSNTHGLRYTMDIFFNCKLYALYLYLQFRNNFFKAVDRPFCFSRHNNFTYPSLSFSLVLT